MKNNHTGGLRGTYYYNSLRHFFNKLKNIMFPLRTFCIQGSIKKKYPYIFRIILTRVGIYLKFGFVFLQQF